MIKKITTILLSVLLLVPGITSSAQENSDKNKVNEASQYWVERFPAFKESIEKNTNGKLVGVDEMYIKYTPIEENDNEKAEGIFNFAGKVMENEFNSKVYTRDEYLRETSMFKPQYIGGFEPNGGGDPYWLRLDLQVYEIGNGKYFAYSFFEWKTRPVFRFTDLQGIYTSSELVIAENTASTPIVGEYIAIDTNGNQSYELTPYEVSQHGNGVLSKIDLLGDSELFQYQYNMGMLQAPVEFSNSTGTTGRIFTNYVHKQIAIGLPQFDEDGKTGFGLEISTDEHSGSVYISR